MNRIILLFVAFLVCLFSLLAQQSSSQQNNVSLNNIMVKGDKWHIAAHLEKEARDLLHKKTDFKETPLTVWIGSEKDQELIVFHYGTGIGKPFWSVQFNKNGKIASFKHGVLGENDSTDFKKEIVK